MIHLSKLMPQTALFKTFLKQKTDFWNHKYLKNDEDPYLHKFSQSFVFYYLTPLFEIYIMLPPGRHTNNGKYIILIKKSPDCHFQDLYLSENRFPIPSILEKWQGAVVAWFYQLFRHVVFDVVSEKLHQVTSRTSYQYRNMHNINTKILQTAIFKIFIYPKTAFRYHQ